ncbi:MULTISPECIES: TIGR04219 family outer membrane beta-barrel protein [Corallincola]|uniref:TIGR04219 family outer membrane beta-barrel protein n=3 Tax=Corallincola TaxID=1775176 RepID=A0A368NQ41_9GAMM|nr:MULTISPECIES: TIGR04219 family outer membrane beta-barrel protein [Corallincola]RCU51589.1 TIGR04219 family outer membrane beta-barrel protein [Corallincola holothuriorum]TAA47091.1 TIGR04219 family outer membrane beta-barrel protein [Corallincola spongiicola]TCI04742.1 TIGR04219 family outer membrane beta-barrel protein [Corallincola luteus]
MHRYNKIFATLLTGGALIAAPAAMADTIAGLYVGAQYWHMSADGSVGSDTTMEDFNLSDDDKGAVWLALEHPVPLLPNLKLRYNQLDTDGEADVTDFEFGGETYNGLATTDLDLDHLDIIMYYEILDNDTVWLDLGLNLKYGDYKVAVTGEIDDGAGGTVSTSTSEKYNGVIPMLYGAGGVGFPFTGLGLFGEANWIGYDSNYLYDVQGGVSWKFLDNPAIDAEIQLGYRKLHFNVDDLSDIYADVDFDGGFIGVQAHF